MKHFDIACKFAVAKWGKGWDYLSPDQKAGAVALELIAVIAAQEATEGSHASRIVDSAQQLLNWAAVLP